jgi:hypothetical protein
MKADPTDALAAAGIPRDPAIEAYKKDVDRTLLRENLKLTVDQRFDKMQDFLAFVTELKRAGRAARAR